jgi:hypothetical protein
LLRNPIGEVPQACRCPRNRARSLARGAALCRSRAPGRFMNDSIIFSHRKRCSPESLRMSRRVCTTGWNRSAVFGPPPPDARKPLRCPPTGTVAIPFCSSRGNRAPIRPLLLIKGLRCSPMSAKPAPLTARTVSRRTPPGRAFALNPALRGAFKQKSQPLRRRPQANGTSSHQACNSLSSANIPRTSARLRTPLRRTRQPTARQNARRSRMLALPTAFLFSSKPSAEEIRPRALLAGLAPQDTGGPARGSAVISHGMVFLLLGTGRRRCAWRHP